MVVSVAQKAVMMVVVVVEERMLTGELAAGLPVVAVELTATQEHHSSEDYLSGLYP